MVLREVREHERGEANAVEAAELGAVRGRLERAAPFPASSISRNVRCRSMASAVVRRRRDLVPDTRLDRPEQARASDPPRRGSRRARYAVVVLPFVPVTPATSSSARRVPEELGGRDRHRPRASSTTSCGTASSSGRSTTSATAPRATASAAKSWPSARRPGRRRTTLPARPPPASYARSLSSTGARPDHVLRCERRDQTLELHLGGRVYPAMFHVRDGSRLVRHTCGVTLEAGTRVEPSPHPGGGLPSFEPGGQFSGLSGGTSRYWSANWASSWKAGAATTPPQMVRGSSTVTRIDQPRPRRRDEPDERRDVAATSSSRCRPGAASRRCRSCRRRGSRAPRPRARASPPRRRRVSIVASCVATSCLRIRRRSSAPTRVRRRARRGAAAARRRRSRPPRTRAAICTGVTAIPWPIGTLPIVEPDHCASGRNDTRPLSPGKSTPVGCRSRSGRPSARAASAELLRERDRPDVRGLREDVARPSCVTVAAARLVDHAVGDLDRRTAA